MDNRRFCPVCAQPLTHRIVSEHERPVCSDSECGFVFWDNPTPVVAAIVEHEGELVLARNATWPHGMFGLVTGFLEPREEPEYGVVREVTEELDLQATITRFVGAYGFARKNQLILAYHLTAEGSITLNEELAEHRHVPKDKARYWPGGTGLAVRDWLLDQGYDPQPMDLPPALAEWLRRSPADD